MQSFAQFLTARPTLLGTSCTLGVDALELACYAGMDFVLIDGQHGAFDLAGLQHALRAAQAAGCFPIARLPAHGLSRIEPLLDAGYPALLAPMVNSEGEARRLVQAAYYPPMGLRSRSGCRASLREGPAYRETFNDDFTLIVMIEHISAVDQVERIMAVPGVTACFVGPTDLASSLESQPAPGQAAFAAAVERVRVACAAAGKPAGIAAQSVSDARGYARQGFRFITLGTDRRFLSAAFEKAVAAWRAEGQG